MNGSRWLRFLFTLLPAAIPLYLVRFQVMGVPTTVLEAYLFLLIARFVWESRGGFLKSIQRGLGRFLLPVIAWVMVTFIAALYAPQVMAGLGVWRAFVLEPVLVFAMARAVLEARDRRILEDVLCATAIGVTGWGIIQFVTGLGIPAPWNVSIEEGRRATGPFPYPNALALFVVPIGAYAWQRLWNPNDDAGWKRLLFVVTWIATLVACVVAKSDGGMVALGAASAFVLLWHRIGRRVLVVGAIGAVMTLFAMPTLRTSLWREVTFQGWSGRVRLMQWQETTAMLRDHWVLGAGMSGYPTVFKPYHKATYIEIFQYPHQIVLNVWVEAGIAGVIIFFWLLAAWGRIAGLRAAAPLIAILVHGLVDVPYFKNDLALVFFLLILLTSTTAIPFGTFAAKEKVDGYSTV